MIADQNQLASDGTATPAIEGLASIISEATATIASYHQQQKTCTGEAVAGSFVVQPDAPPDVMAAKRVLLEATSSLQALVMSPTDFHTQCGVHLQHLASYRWLVNFKIPDHVPLETSIDYQAVAELANVPEHQLVRLARLAMTGGFFQEPTPGRIAHTPLSAGFCSSSPLRDGMLFLTETNLPTATKIVEMTRGQQLLQTQQSPPPTPPPTPPKTSFQLAHNTPLPFFPYLSQNPHIAQRLASGMRTVAASLEASPSHLLGSFDWSALPPQAHIVDLGGSHGHVSLFLARHFPSLRFTVQELPPVVASAPPPPPELQGRVKFQAHSFLEPQPEGETCSDNDDDKDDAAAAADVFLIRQCLNNWPHSTAVQILRNLVPSLAKAAKTKPHARLLINNIVVPRPFSTRADQHQPEPEHEAKAEVEAEAETPPKSRTYGAGSRDESLARTRDAVMLQLMDGAERDLGQWRGLLAEVDARLEIVAVRKPRGSLLSLIEVRFVAAP